MKKMNKKGFTLIELLAVIIILGVLMIIAIPSVTSYIQNSRKNAYVDSAVAYIDAVRTKVNEGKDLKFFSTDVLYMVPVGHDSTKACVSLESGGKSPFSDTWNYAYVGVSYSGDSYDYFFIGEDGSNQGIRMVAQDKLAKDGADLLYSSYASSYSNTGNLITSALATVLGQRYALTANGVYGDTASSDPVVTAYATSEKEELLTHVSLTKSNVIYIAAGSCNYE